MFVYLIYDCLSAHAVCPWCGGRRGLVLPALQQLSVRLQDGAPASSGGLGQAPSAHTLDQTPAGAALEAAEEESSARRACRAKLLHVLGE